MTDKEKIERLEARIAKLEKALGLFAQRHQWGGDDPYPPRCYIEKPWELAQKALEK